METAAARCVADAKEVYRVFEKETLLLNFQCFISSIFLGDAGGRILEVEHLSDISFSGCMKRQLGLNKYSYR